MSLRDFMEPEDAHMIRMMDSSRYAQMAAQQQARPRSLIDMLGLAAGRAAAAQVQAFPQQFPQSALPRKKVESKVIEPPKESFCVIVDEFINHELYGGSNE